MRNFEIKHERPPKDLEKIIDNIRKLLDEADKKDYPITAMLQYGYLTICLGEYPLIQLSGF